MTHASLSEHVRATAGITDNSILLAVGCEDADDIVEDLRRALASLPAAHGIGGGGPAGEGWPRFGPPATFRRGGLSRPFGGGPSGMDGTDLQRHSRLLRFLDALLAMKPREDAAPTVRAATDPAPEGDDCIGPDGWPEMRGAPVQVGRSDPARGSEDARRLWPVGEDWTARTVPAATTSS